MATDNIRQELLAAIVPMSRDGYLPPGVTQQMCDEAQPGYWDGPEPKRRRRGPVPKPPEQRRRNNLTFRLRDQLKADLQKSAAANGRSLSEEIEYRLEHAFQWEKLVGDMEVFKALILEIRRRNEVMEENVPQ